MKALTLHQPWATLIASGHKTIETRSWPTRHRGAIAIHAAKTVPSWVLPLNIGGFEVDKDNPAGTAPSYLLRGPIAWPYRLPLGCVVATADLIDCVPMVQFLSRWPGDEPDPPWTPWDGSGKPPIPCLAINSDRSKLTLHGPYREVTDQLPFGDYTPGRWAWLLDNVQRIQPVPARGKQGLWEWAS